MICSISRFFKNAASSLLFLWGAAMSAGFVFMALPCASGASPLDFTIFRLGSAPETVLVVGGIQGDEPGGFSAASLLASRYEIRKGSVWVVPNLNFPSIIKRSRGLYGDMNRKFAFLDERDPEYGTVRRIQKLIAEPQVHLVLNLHDGSGFYRPSHEDSLKNPRRWGQSIIIDQEGLAAGVFMGDLAILADAVARRVNGALIRPHHALHVRNTNTAAGDREMEKSLSYFAVRQGKAAFGLEASKEAPVAWRAYYHLAMVEAFLAHAGIEFSRDFELTPSGVAQALSDNLGISFAGNRIFIPLEDARPNINLLPLPANGVASAITSKPIMAVLPSEDKPGQFCIHYGNRKIASIMPDWRELTEEIDAVSVIVDGERTLAPFGRIIDVKQDVMIEKMPGYRVNAIGFGTADDSGIPLRRRGFESRFSIDRAATLFRVEVYKDKNFAGMFLLRFKNIKTLAKKSPILPSTKGPESSLGF